MIDKSLYDFFVQNTLITHTSNIDMIIILNPPLVIEYKT